MTTYERAAGEGVVRREWRELGSLALQSLVTGLFASFVLGLAVFIISFQAQAGESRRACQGTLLLRGDAADEKLAPLLFTDVHIAVSGMVARVKVSQRFVNPTAQWREGVYVFPLADKAAVDHLKLQVGERVVEGEIKERIEARRTYDNANAEGRKASLIEQERPNLFTASVANIGPNEEVVVALEYEETLRYDDGSFRLRFPLAVTPRYVPGALVAAAGPMDGPMASPAMLDAERIAPPFADTGDGYVNPVAIAVDLNAGFPLARVDSTYHAITVEENPGNRYRLTLGDAPVPANRDFELVWTPDVGAAPGAALFTETRGGKTYALLMALPPSARDATVLRTPREITYIIDTSGSMEGVSIVQAREALQMALARLSPGDSFNIIEFNSTATSLFSAPMPVDESTIGKAKGFVGGLRARGGTEMLSALQLALAGERESARVRQVVFLTDGAVGNEDAVLRLLHDNLGDRRLFTIGIGPAPNTFFLDKAAQYGRGTFTYIGDVREVKEKMTALFRKLENPAITDLAIDWPGATEMWPRSAPDLYAGEPVIVTAQFPAGTLDRTVAIHGKRAGAAWGVALPVGDGAQEPGVAVLWARAKIDALMDARRQGAPEADIREAVVNVALTHHLVSKYTSLVAVDTTPTRPGGVEAIKTALPLNVPDGLAGFDRLPRTATPAPLLMALGSLLLVAAGMVAVLRRRFTSRHA